MLKNTNSYYNSKIKLIKKVARRNIFPPVYKFKNWENKHLNCYAYALDLDVSDRREMIFLPGFISNMEADASFSSKELVENIKKDLDFLNISYRNNKRVLREGEYRIAIYFQLAKYHDWPIEFHIIRQDRTGSWSEKPSWNGKIRKVGEKSDMPPNLEKHGFKLCSVIILSKKDVA